MRLIGFELWNLFLPNLGSTSLEEFWLCLQGELRLGLLINSQYIGVSVFPKSTDENQTVQLHVAEECVPSRRKEACMHFLNETIKTNIEEEAGRLWAYEDFVNLSKDGIAKLTYI